MEDLAILSERHVKSPLASSGGCALSTSVLHGGLSRCWGRGGQQAPPGIRLRGACADDTQKVLARGHCSHTRAAGRSRPHQPRQGSGRCTWHAPAGVLGAPRGHCSPKVRVCSLCKKGQRAELVWSEVRRGDHTQTEAGSAS